MEKLFYHTVSIYKKPCASYHKDEFAIKEVEILASNELYTVINDSYFTKLDNKSSLCHDLLGKERISIRTNGDILGEGIFYKLYSRKKKRPSTIKRHIEKEIASNFGWLMSEVDLSIIK